MARTTRPSGPIKATPATRNSRKAFSVPVTAACSALFLIACPCRTSPISPNVFMNVPDTFNTFDVANVRPVNPTMASPMPIRMLFAAGDMLVNASATVLSAAAALRILGARADPKEMPNASMELIRASTEPFNVFCIFR